MLFRSDGNDVEWVWGQFLLVCGERRAVGEEEDILMRDVEGQGIGRTRNAGNCQAGSVIWRMHTCGKGIEKHIPVLSPHGLIMGVICTHLDVGGGLTS